MSEGYWITTEQHAQCEAERERLREDLDAVRFSCEDWHKVADSRSAEINRLAAELAAAKALLRELVILEADGKHADESAIEVWERIRAALGEDSNA